jgi:acyl-CoA dehydrogenase
MSEMTDIIVDTTRKIFEDLGDPQTIINAKDEAWRDSLWQALDEGGLTRAWASEAAGGAALSVADTFEIIRVAGAHAVALPLVPHLLAVWLLDRANIALPEGIMTVSSASNGAAVSIDAEGRVSGRLSAVAFAEHAQFLAVLADGTAGPTAALVALDNVGIEPGVDAAGDSFDTVTLNAVPAISAAAVDLQHDELELLGAAMAAMAVAGAFEGALKMCVSYSQDRIAFGRPIAKFQAVQHLLARLAEETAAVVAAAASAAFALEQANRPSAAFVDIASAKIRAGEAVNEGGLIAHQVHGAIGFTADHPLHRYVQRMWAWRDQFGREAQWAERLGRHFAAQGGDAFWKTITAA